MALGGDRRALSAAGWPPLFYAVENSAPLPGRGNEPNRHLALVRHILELDTAEGVWATAARGRTALMVAAMQDAADCVHALAQVQPWSVAWADEGGRTAAHWAAVRGATNALEALLARGAAPTVRDKAGATPGDLLPPLDSAPRLRQWEAEREGAAGERRWDYAAVVEATAFRCRLCGRAWARSASRARSLAPRRYIKKAGAAVRPRDEANERQCNACKVRERCDGVGQRRADPIRLIAPPRRATHSTRCAAQLAAPSTTVRSFGGAALPQTYLSLQAALSASARTGAAAATASSAPIALATMNERDTPRVRAAGGVRDRPRRSCGGAGAAALAAAGGVLRRARAAVR